MKECKAFIEEGVHPQVRICHTCQRALIGQTYQTSHAEICHGRTCIGVQQQPCAVLTATLTDALPKQAIIKAFRKAATLAVQLVKDASVSIEGKDPEDKKALLRKCAETTLNSKLASPAPAPLACDPWLKGRMRSLASRKLDKPSSELCMTAACSDFLL